MKQEQRKCPETNAQILALQKGKTFKRYSLKQRGLLIKHNHRGFIFIPSSLVPILLYHLHNVSGQRAGIFKMKAAILESFYFPNMIKSIRSYAMGCDMRGKIKWSRSRNDRVPMIVLQCVYYKKYPGGSCFPPRQEASSSLSSAPSLVIVGTFVTNSQN